MGFEHEVSFLRLPRDFNTTFYSATPLTIGGDSCKNVLAGMAFWARYPYGQVLALSSSGLPPDLAL